MKRASLIVSVLLSASLAHAADPVTTQGTERYRTFATYIISMHRPIHKLWTFGFVADQDARKGTGHFDDMTLWTQLQIAVKRDGSLDKLRVIRASGNPAFDGAAMDSVRLAAPFQPTPAEIRSADGDVYMDWQFHRDERTCGTFGVDPHILDAAGDAVPIGSGTLSDIAKELTDVFMRRAAPRLATLNITAQVYAAADGWLSAWTRGDVPWLAGWSAVPFLVNGHLRARTPEELKAMYRDLVRDDADRTLDPVELLSADELREREGALPPGGENNMLFAIAHVKGRPIVLFLMPATVGWRVAGLVQ